jgi:hypothetical protein
MAKSSQEEQDSSKEQFCCTNVPKREMVWATIFSTSSFLDLAKVGLIAGPGDATVAGRGSEEVGGDLRVDSPKRILLA